MEEKNESKKYSNSEENDAAENMSEEKTSEDNDRLDYIIKSGGVVSKTKDETIQCLTIIGQIEGHYNLGDGQSGDKVRAYNTAPPLDRGKRRDRRASCGAEHDGRRR